MALFRKPKPKAVIGKPSTFQTAEQTDINKAKAADAPKAAAFNEQLKNQREPITKQVKGGVSQDGKFYPTTDQKFVPNPEAAQITFNRDKTVSISPQGSKEIINLSASENQILNDVNMGRASSRLGSGASPELKQAVAAQQPQQEAIMPQTTEETLSPQMEQVGGFDIRNKPLVARTLTAVAQGIDTTTGIIGGILGINLSPAKSTEVKKAEAAFADNSAVIEKQISDYKMGIGNKAEIARSIEMSQSSILDLYKQTKGLGQANLRFWLDQGKEIEAQMQRELTTLESQRRMLNVLP